MKGVDALLTPRFHYGESLIRAQWECWYNPRNNLRTFQAGEGSRAMNPFFWIPVAIIIIYLLNSIKILPEYERGVIFRLGRVLSAAKGPGVILVFAPVDR